MSSINTIIKLNNGELDLSKLTVIIGPNLSGKSAILKCIYSSVPAPEKFNLGSYTEPFGECQVEEGENFDYVVYIDVYAITYRIYEEVRDLINEWNGEVYIPGFGVTGMLND
jgi:ABC-type molybdenum transport system ATPase subunit/photorepair protein PhrA